jgi:hypothetical protein
MLHDVCHLGKSNLTLILLLNRREYLRSVIFNWLESSLWHLVAHILEEITIGLLVNHSILPHESIWIHHLIISISQHINVQVLLLLDYLLLLHLFFALVIAIPHPHPPPHRSRATYNSNWGLLINTWLMLYHHLLFATLQFFFFLFSLSLIRMLFTPNLILHWSTFFRRTG